MPIWGWRRGTLLVISKYLSERLIKQSHLLAPDTTSIESLTGSRTKLLPYTNFNIEVLTQYRIKLLHVEVLTNVRIKLLHIEVLTIFPDKTSILTKLIKNPPPLPDPTRSSTSLKQDHL